MQYHLDKEMQAPDQAEEAHDEEKQLDSVPQKLTQSIKQRPKDVLLR